MRHAEDYSGQSSPPELNSSTKTAEGRVFGSGRSENVNNSSVGAEAEHREILRQALAGEVEPSFDKLAADLRKLTRRRKQTPSEILLREGREEQ